MLLHAWSQFVPPLGSKALLDASTTHDSGCAQPARLFFVHLLRCELLWQATCVPGRRLEVSAVKLRVGSSAQTCVSGVVFAPWSSPGRSWQGTRARCQHRDAIRCTKLLQRLQSLGGFSEEGTASWTSSGSQRVAQSSWVLNSNNLGRP